MDCHILDRSPCHYMRQSYHTGVFSTLRSLSNDDGDGNESGNRLAKQQLGTSITLLFHILAVVARLTTWECLISRFVEDGNSRQQLYFSFLELWYSSLGFKSNRLGLRIYILRACLHGGGGPQIGEVTYVAGHPTYHVNVIMRDYMDRWVTSPTWGSPPPCKQALKGGSGLLSNVFFCCNKFAKLLAMWVKSYYYHPFTPAYYTRGGERGYKC